MMHERQTVAIADDHPLMRAALATTLSEACDVVATVGDGRALLESALRLNPRLVVADAVMPVLDGIQAAAQLRTSLPRTGVIIISGYDDAGLRARAVEAGVQGWLSKSAPPAELMAAVQAVGAGGQYFAARDHGGLPLATPPAPAVPMAPLAVTPREREVLQLIARGFTMKESATLLGITPRTVAFHKYRMMQQLKVSSTAELVKLALRHGIE